MLDKAFTHGPPGSTAAPEVQEDTAGPELPILICVFQLIVVTGSRLMREIAAVRAALLLPSSNGRVEGQISRTKTIKRTMYGRTGFELLRRHMYFWQLQIFE